MAYGPPSYQAAEYRQLWPIVAPYIHSLDLYRACLVCRQWHQLFAPFLWGDPARKFGLDDDNIYLNLTRFKRLLARARPEVRRLAHTLHIPPAQPEFYDGPHAGWLRDILDRLPCLQALIVSNLAFFDPSCLRAINQQSPSSATYPLRLLIASNCENTTASSLTTALAQFPELVYLDLSTAQGARSPYVLRQIGTLSELRVLKLRNCGLRDDDVDHLMFSSGFRSLDVSFNHLTEKGMTKLLAKLKSAEAIRSLSPYTRRYSGVPLPTRVVAGGLDKFVIRKLTSGVDGYLGIEEGMPAVFSHLNVASNVFPVDVIVKYADRHDFQYLDCGSMNLSRVSLPISQGTSQFSESVQTQILSPAIFKQAFRNLRSLRIHHSLITSQPFFGTETSSETCFELHSEDLRYELDSDNVAPPGFFELDDTSISVVTDASEPDEVAHTIFDSPDDVGAAVPKSKPTHQNVNFAQSTTSHELRSATSVTGMRVSFAPAKPTTSAQPAQSTTDTQSTASESLLPIDIPPSFESLDSNQEAKVMMPDELKTLGTYWDIKNTDKGKASPSTEHSTTAASSQLNTSMANQTTQPQTSPSTIPDSPEASRAKSTPILGSPSQYPTAKSTIARDLLEAATKRQNHTAARERHPGRFKPSLLPSLKSLTLTDVPSTTWRPAIPDSLALFIQECAEEEEIARLQEDAKLEAINYPLNTFSPTQTLKLANLVLEMTSQPDPIGPLQSPRRKRSSFTTKSSTEDPDSEVFMNSINSDFSFFREDDGGLLVSKGRIDGPAKGEDVGGEGREIDVVMELSSFRRAKKREFEEAKRAERWGVEEVLSGFWRGEVKVVREGSGG